MAGLLVLTACGQQLPKPECDTNPAFDGAALRCDAAVAGAVSRLVPDHPPIERIQFLFGSATPCCSVLVHEGVEQPVPEYVVFTYTDGSRRQYVPLTWSSRGLTLGEPAPY